MTRFGGELRAVGGAGDGDIRQQEIDRPAARQDLERACAIARGQHAVAEFPKAFGGDRQHILIILDDEDGAAVGTGG
jgi:hypothetical protein